MTTHVATKHFDEVPFLKKGRSASVLPNADRGKKIATQIPQSAKQNTYKKGSIEDRMDSENQGIVFLDN